MGKKPRLGSDPFTFIHDSREKEQRKRSENDNQQQEKPEQQKALKKVVQLDQSILYQEMIEALYSELSRVSDSVADLNDKALANLFDNLTSQLSLKVSEQLSSLTELVQTREKELAALRQNAEADRSSGRVELEKVLQEKEELIASFDAKKQAYDILIQSKDAERAELKEGFNSDQIFWQQLNHHYLNKLERLSSLLLLRDKEVGNLRKEKHNSEQAAQRYCENNEELKNEVNEKESILSDLQEESQKLKEKLETGTSRIKELEEVSERLRSFEETAQRLHKQREELTAKLAEKDSVLSELQEESQKLKEKIEIGASRLKEIEQDARHFESLLQFRDNELKRLNNDLQQLNKWMEQLQKGVTVFFESKRWKMGNALGDLQNNLLFKREVPMPEDFINDIILQYEKWKSQ